jgi:hypothetical protein
MSEASGFWTTNAAGSGDQQASYSQADFSDAYRILSACAGFEGVAVGFLNELACTDGGAETVDVDTGGAMVDGKWFLNDASQSKTITSAVGAGNTRIDRVVLRADWANFNVSVHVIAGTDAASPTAPAVTQTSETTYDIKLCQALVDTSGNITITDEREWAAPEVDDATIEVDQTTGRLQVKDAGIDADAIAAGAVDTSELATNAVTTAKITDANVTEAKLATDSVTAAKIAAGAVGNSELAADSVDDTKAGNRVPQFYRRQGGDASGWIDTGTTNYIPTTVRMQAGAAITSSGEATITFPTAFSDKPIVLVSSSNELSGSSGVIANARSVTASGFTAKADYYDGTDAGTVAVVWLAIGPE